MSRRTRCTPPASARPRRHPGRRPAPSVPSAAAGPRSSGPRTARTGPAPARRSPPGPPDTRSGGAIARRGDCTPHRAGSGRSVPQRLGHGGREGSSGTTPPRQGQDGQPGPRQVEPAAEVRDRDAQDLRRWAPVRLAATRLDQGRARAGLDPAGGPEADVVTGRQAADRQADGAHGERADRESDGRRAGHQQPQQPPDFRGTAADAKSRPSCSLRVTFTSRSRSTIAASALSCRR